MASYISGMTDGASPQIPQTPLYNMDTGFLQNTLDRRYARYQQGESALNQAYSSIVNAPLTGQRTREARDKYLQDAQYQLQEISTSDLSDPTNQANARKIFEPFWKDKSIIWDSGLTSAYQKESQRALGARDSKDEKVRETFDPVIMRYLQGMEKDIADADGDVGRLQSVQQRKFTPLHNINKELTERAKAAGYKVTRTSTDGFYIREEENGPESLISWQTFGLTNAGNEFAEDFRIRGIVDKEDRIGNIQAQFPGITKEQALTMTAEDVASDLRNSLVDNVSVVAKDMQKLEAMKGKITGSTAQDEALRGEYDFKIGQLAVQKSVSENELSSLNYDEQKRTFLANPDGYMAMLYRDRVVKNWAVGMASNQSEKLTYNPAVKALADIQEQEKESGRKDQELILAINEDKRKQAESEKKLTGLTTDAFGNKIDPVTGQVVNPTLSYSGQDVNALQNVNTLDAYNSHVANLENAATADFFDPEGMLLFSDTLPGMTSPADRMMAGSALKKYLSGQTPSVEEQEKLRVLQNGLWEKFPSSGAKGPYQTKQKLIQYAETVIGTLQNNPKGAVIDSDHMEAMTKFLSYQDTQSKIDGLRAERDKVIKEKVLTKKEYAPLVVGKGDEKRLMTTKDLEKDFQDIVVYPTGNPITDPSKAMKYTKSQLAKLFEEGRINLNAERGIHIDGKYYQIWDVGNTKTKSPAEYAWYDPLYQHQQPSEEKFGEMARAISGKYGSAKDFSELKKKVEKEVVPNLTQYQAETGKIGNVFALSGDRMYNTARELALPGNGSSFKLFTNGKEEILPVDQTEALQSILSSEALSKNYLTDMNYHTNGPNGEKFMSFYVRPKTDKDPVADNVGDLGGKQIRVALSPNARGSFINTLPDPSVNLQYSQLKEGKVIKSPPIFDKLGASYEIVPNSTQDPYSVTLYMQPSVIDLDPKSPTYGTKIPGAKIKEPFNLQQFSPAEIVARAHQFVQSTMASNQARYQQYQQMNKK